MKTLVNKFAPPTCAQLELLCKTGGDFKMLGEVVPIRRISAGTRVREGPQLYRSSAGCGT